MARRCRNTPDVPGTPATFRALQMNCLVTMNSYPTLPRTIVLPPERARRTRIASYNGAAVLAYAPLYRACLDRLGDPGDDLVKHLIQRSGRLEAENPLGLVGGRNAALHIVLEGLVVQHP